MVVAIAMAVSITAAIVVAKSKIQRDWRTNVGRIGIAWIIVGVVGRGIRRPIDSTSAKAADDHQANSKTLHCTHTWSVHLRSPNANLVSF